LVRQAADGTPATLGLTLAAGVSVQLSLRPASTGSGLLLAECRDLTAQRELEARAALGSQMLGDVLARSQEATMMIDPAGRVSLVNEEAASLLGLETARILGAPPVKLLQEAGVQLLTPDGGTRLDYRRWTRQTMPPEQEVMLVNSAGTRRILQVRLRLLPGLSGQRPAAVLTLRDVSKLRRVEARLQHDHHHDSLTGLLNRSGLLARLGSLTAGGQGAVIALDIGGFPALTAALGRTASDALLVQLAARLSGWRKGALAARLGENVFALGLPASPHEGLEADLRELRRALRQPLRAGGRDVPLSFNLGGMEAGVGADPGALIGGADTALGYLGKEGPGLETVY
ncbi:MAG: diguanylate cyclase domain-containing protein, partial [Deinococcus sp.]